MNPECIIVRRPINEEKGRMRGDTEFFSPTDWKNEQGKKTVINLPIQGWSLDSRSTRKAFAYLDEEIQLLDGVVYQRVGKTKSVISRRNNSLYREATYELVKGPRT